MSDVVISPDRHRAVVFDLDGVVTDTASLHFRAWKHLFDDFFDRREPTPGEDHRAFSKEDYKEHVDGKARRDGVRSFLTSRGIELPEGSEDDPDDRCTVYGLGNRKNRLFRQRLEADGVAVFDSTVELARDLQRRGIGTAVISASRNCRQVLESAGLGGLFPVRVDGVVADDLGLRGKPQPDMFVEAAERLGASPAHTVVVEDARAGVRAGREGNFGLVVGVERDGTPDALRDSGAHIVVADLSEVRVAGDGSDQRHGDGTDDDRRPEDASQRPLSAVPDALASWDDVMRRLSDRSPVFFLDFDGTLAPIVDDPTEVAMTSATRSALEDLAEVAPVAIVSGRDLHDVEQLAPLDGAWFAGSHGFEIAGPDGTDHRHPGAEDALPALDEAERDCHRRLDDVDGATVDRKRYALAVHYRQVDGDERVDEVVGAAREIARSHGLRATGGRKVVELRPDIDWHKGKAVDWLMETIVPNQRSAVAIYAGDDITDEDALAAVRKSGLGIVVRSDEAGDRLTSAHVAVDDTEEMARLLARFAEAQRATRNSRSGRRHERTENP